MPGRDQYTKLLLHCDGTNGSTTFTDSEIAPTKSVTTGGACTISTAQYKFNGASGRFPGADADVISIGDSDDFDFGTSNFTIDFWIRFNTTKSTMYFFGRNNAVDYSLELNSSTLNFYTANSSLISTSWSPSTSTWYHVAVARSSTTLALYIDGVQKTTASNSTNFTFSSSLYIGGRPAGGNYSIDCWIDEFRLSKGIARWTANFTPSTKPYGSVTHCAVFFEDYKPG